MVDVCPGRIDGSPLVVRLDQVVVEIVPGRTVCSVRSGPDEGVVVECDRGRIREGDDGGLITGMVGPTGG